MVRICKTRQQVPQALLGYEEPPVWVWFDNKWIKQWPPFYSRLHSETFLYPLEITSRPKYWTYDDPTGTTFPAPGPSWCWHLTKDGKVA